MELDELRTFVAVAEAGSVNRAAYALRLSQPAVTRQVQRLEATLGISLLDRRAKPAVLTAAGRVALEHCRAVLRAVAMLQAATAGGDGPSGDCRIGVAAALADLSLPECVDHVRRLFPRVSLKITTGWSGTMLEQLRSGILDEAFVHLPVADKPPGEFNGRVIGTKSLVFVAARNHRIPPVVPIESLAAAAWVLNPDGCGFRATLRRALQRVNAPLDVAVEAYGADLHLALVARGVGVGLVPTRTFARSPHRSDLRTFRLKGYDPHVAVWALRGHAADSLSPVLDALERHFVQNLRKSDARRSAMTPVTRSRRTGKARALAIRKAQTGIEK
jgi:DNA-binding transcriptional LysR family regulator